MFRQLGVELPSGRDWNWQIPENNEYPALRASDWQRADGEARISSTLSRVYVSKKFARCFSHRFYKYAYLKKKTVLRLIFVLFCFVGILLSRKANKIIEEAYVSVIVGVVIALSPAARLTSYGFVCLLCIQILTFGTCNCSNGNCCLNKKRYSTWGKIPSPVGLWTQ